MKGREVSFYKNDVTLTISVDKDLSNDKNNANGTLTVGGLTNDDQYHADNMEYVSNFESNKNEIKADLKKLNQHYSGVMKDIAWVIKEARNWGYLNFK